MSLEHYMGIPESQRFDQLVADYSNTAALLRLYFPSYHPFGCDYDVCFAYLNNDSKTYDLYGIFNSVIENYLSGVDFLLGSLPDDVNKEVLRLEKEFTSFDKSKENGFKKAVAGMTLINYYLKVGELYKDIVCELVLKGGCYEH